MFLGERNDTHPLRNCPSVHERGIMGVDIVDARHDEVELSSAREMRYCSEERRMENRGSPLDL